MRSFIPLILLLFGTSYAVGQALPPGTIGRSRDGRAFRVDESGFRLTDQLAELEVTVEELKKQNLALENEIELKQRMLNECGTKPKPLTEKDLLGSAASQHKAAEVPPSCDRLTQPLQERIAELEQKTGDNSAAFCSRFTKPLEQQIAQLQNAGTNSSEKFTHDLNDARSAVKRQEETLAARDAKIADLESRLASLSAEHGAGRAGREAAESGAGRIKTESVKAEQPRAREQARSPQRAAEVQKTLASIQKLIVRRKDLADSQRGRGKGVSIRLQPLVTSKNESLDSLRSAASRASNDEEVSALLSKLREVSAVLENDIQTLERIAR